MSRIITPKSDSYYTNAIFGLRRNHQRLVLGVLLSIIAHGLLLIYAEHVRRGEWDERNPYWRVDCCASLGLILNRNMESEPLLSPVQESSAILLRHVSVLPTNHAHLEHCSSPRDTAQVARLSFEWRSRSVEQCLDEHPINQQLYGAINVTVTRSFVGTTVLSRHDTRLSDVDDIEELAQCMSDAISRMPLIGIEFCAMTKIEYALDVKLLPSSRHTAALSAQEAYLRELREHMPPPREDLYIPDSPYKEERFRKDVPERVVVSVHGPTTPEQVARIEAAAEQRYDAAITQLARCETLLRRMAHVNSAFHIRHTYSHVGTLVSAHVVPRHEWRDDFRFYARCVDQMLQKESLHTSHFEAMTQVDYVVRLKR